MKKLLVLLTSAAMVFGLCACGGGTATTTTEATTSATTTAETTTETTTEETTTEKDPMVDSIDLTIDKNNLKYVRFEQANEGLTDDADNALVFVFDFTNNNDDTAECQNTFRIQFFQNGTELSDDTSWSSNGGDQYELVNAYFNEALKGGTVTFGKIVVPKDDSTITIKASKNGGSSEDEYQMMEVDISGESGDSGEADASADVSSDEIDAALQGTWTLGDAGSFSFDSGNVTMISGGSSVSGTYEVNTDDAQVELSLQGTDGVVSAHLPYTYTDGELVIYNSQNEALTKQ